MGVCFIHVLYVQLLTIESSMRAQQSEITHFEVMGRQVEERLSEVTTNERARSVVRRLLTSVDERLTEMDTLTKAICELTHRIETLTRAGFSVFLSCSSNSHLLVYNLDMNNTSWKFNNWRLNY